MSGNGSTGLWEHTPEYVRAPHYLAQGEVMWDGWYSHSSLLDPLLLPADGSLAPEVITQGQLEAPADIWAFGMLSEQEAGGDIDPSMP